jgi:hypothetical protein
VTDIHQYLKRTFFIEVKVKFAVEQATKAQRGGGGIARWGGWSPPCPGCFTLGKYPVPIVWEAGWAPGPVWKGAEYLAPTRIRSRIFQPLYRLSYPGPPTFFIP